jgi:hypothetical protein
MAQEKISVTINGDRNFGESSSIYENTFVEFTLVIYELNNNRLIYNNTFRGRLSDNRIDSELKNIKIPETLRGTFTSLGVSLDLSIINPNSPKIQFVSIIDKKKSKIVKLYTDDFGQYYPNTFEVSSENDIELDLTYLKSETDMVNYFNNNGLDFNKTKFESADQYYHTILELEKEIKLAELELKNYKNESGRVLKNTLGISKDETSEDFLLATNNYLEGFINNLDDKYTKLATTTTLKGDDKLKSDLVRTIKSSLVRYLAIING